MRATVRILIVGSLAGALAPACSLGQGTGCVAGTLDVPDCWSGPFDLHPDFFAAATTDGPALEIRVQNGQDYETFSDGLLVLVDDLGVVRGDPLADGSPRPSLLDVPLVVALPANIEPAGVPVKAVANASIVHAALYLRRSCRTVNAALYALDAVSLEADGTCTRPVSGEPPSPCPGPATLASLGTSDASAPAESMDASADATTAQVEDASVSSSDAGALVCGMASPTWPGNIATSTMTFSHLFDGNPSESNDQQRLTDASFDLYFADPRDVCSGGLGPPPRCQAHLQGNFHFYFQRGRPAQPFP